MPPLAGKFWYPMLFDYMQANPDTDIQDPFLLGQHRRDTEQLGGVDPCTSSWENTEAYYGTGKHQKPPEAAGKP
ncbi:uncharacterized protein FPRN_05606 [Fusarium proliferatum]|nr:uncharacterized protein FPRN_05606 [Fusarium proliferatum]